MLPTSRSPNWKSFASAINANSALLLAGNRPTLVIGIARGRRRSVGLAHLKLRHQRQVAALL